MQCTAIIAMTIGTCVAIGEHAGAQGQQGQEPSSAVGQKSAAAATHPEYDRRQVVPFLDGTYIGLARSRAKLRDVHREPEWTFDADIVPNFVIHQTFFDIISEEDEKVNALRTQAKVGLVPEKRSEFRYAWSIVGVPMVRLRMFINDTSAPVRTPSFMPKGTFQNFWFKLGINDRLNVLNAQVTIGHHSNGQDGCLYVGQTRDENQADRPCTPEVPVDRSFRTLNRDDGSFSTNYMQFGFRFRNVVLDPPTILTDGSRDRTSNRDTTIGMDVEINPRGFLGGAGISDDLRARYGGNRLSVLGGLGWRKGCQRLETKGFIKHIFGTGEDVPAWAGSIELQCLLGSTNWGPFVRYFAGQDYYNLAFQDDTSRLMIGMSYSQEGFLRFRPGAQQAK
jgi:hypothetical protein